jgi:hypothetical protein
LKKQDFYRKTGGHFSEILLSGLARLTSVGGLLHFMSTTQRSQWIECQKVSLESRSSKRRAGRPRVGQNHVAHLAFVILGGLALLKTMTPLEEDFPEFDDPAPEWVR